MTQLQMKQIVCDSIVSPFPSQGSGSGVSQKDSAQQGRPGAGGSEVCVMEGKKEKKRGEEEREADQSKTEK
jgi:hypothetical protein